MGYHTRLSNESRRAQWTEDDSMGVVLWGFIVLAVVGVGLLWWAVA